MTAEWQKLMGVDEEEWLRQVLEYRSAVEGHDVAEELWLALKKNPACKDIDAALADLTDHVTDVRDRLWPIGIRITSAYESRMWYYTPAWTTPGGWCLDAVGTGSGMTWPSMPAGAPTLRELWRQIRAAVHDFTDGLDDGSHAATCEIGRKRGDYDENELLLALIEYLHKRELEMATGCTIPLARYLDEFAEMTYYKDVYELQHMLRAGRWAYNVGYDLEYSHPQPVAKMRRDPYVLAWLLQPAGHSGRCELYRYVYLRRFRDKRGQEG